MDNTIRAVQTINNFFSSCIRSIEQGVDKEDLVDITSFEVFIFFRLLRKSQNQTESLEMPDDAGTRIVDPQCGSPDGHISDKKSLTLTYLPHGKRESRKAAPLYSLALNNLHVFLECFAGLYIAYSLHLIPTRFINLDIAHS